jgi:hypothetical protein
LTWGGALIVVGGPWTIAWLTGRGSMRASTGRRRLGKLLQFIGFGGFAASYFVALLLRKHDSCGHWNSPWIAVSFGGLVVGMLGILIRNSSEWGAIASIASLDIGLAISLTGGFASGQRAVGVTFTLLTVHGVCAGVAAWWSWRARSAVRGDIRARASEAGRTLAAAWLVFAVLGVSGSLFGSDAAELKMQDSVAVKIFVVGAIALVMGSGYTKYAEAMQALASVRADHAEPDQMIGPANGSHRGLTAMLLVLAVVTQVFTRSRGNESRTD